MTMSKVKAFFGFTEEEEQPFIQESTKEFFQKKPPIKGFKGSLINAQNSRPFPASEIKVEEPRIYEDSLGIATQLREKKPVIVNLKFLDKQTSKRLIDFICGTAYAINGHMMKIGENIFLFTPSTISITSSENTSPVEETDIQPIEKDLFFQKVSGL